jgi:hypothetical protein
MILFFGRVIGVTLHFQRQIVKMGMSDTVVDQGNGEKKFNKVISRSFQFNQLCTEPFFSISRTSYRNCFICILTRNATRIFLHITFLILTSITVVLVNFGFLPFFSCHSLQLPTPHSLEGMTKLGQHQK